MVSKALEYVVTPNKQKKKTKLYDQSSFIYQKGMEVAGLLEAYLQLEMDVVFNWEEDELNSDDDSDDNEHELEESKKVDFLWDGSRWQDPGLVVEWTHIEGLDLTSERQV